MNPFLPAFFPPTIVSASSHTGINLQAKRRCYGISSLQLPFLQLGVLHIVQVIQYKHGEHLSLFQVTTEAGHGPFQNWTEFL